MPRPLHGMRDDNMMSQTCVRYSRPHYTVTEKLRIVTNPKIHLKKFNLQKKVC